MRGRFEPLADPSLDEIAEHLARAHFDDPMEDRNAYANSLLAWAEGVDEETFRHFRSLVIQNELAINAKDWVSRFGGDHDDAINRQVALLQEMTRKTAGRRRTESLEEFLGPDIPQILNQGYTALAEARQRREPNA